tara:strand:- start:257 stop:406 length:150 start_codon:yes stop_codon:yes gene_type:complete
MFSQGYQMNNPDTISARFHPDSWSLPEILVDAMADAYIGKHKNQRIVTI